jgi:metal-responsive CopG/Arc/MetJ family transcriptional regulator
MPKPRRRKLGRPPTGRISVHVFLDKKLDEELSKVAAREGVHRSVIVERALAKELQVSVNHNHRGHLEKALGHLLSAEKLLSSAVVKTT